MDWQWEDMKLGSSQCQGPERGADLGARVVMAPVPPYMLAAPPVPMRECVCVCARDCMCVRMCVCMCVLYVSSLHPTPPASRQCAGVRAHSNALP